MAVVEPQTEISDEAQRLLDEAAQRQELPDMKADTKVSILGTTVALPNDFVLGQHVEFKVSGYVCEVGDRLIENEGKRRIVKVQSGLIELVEEE